MPPGALATGAAARDDGELLAVGAAGAFLGASYLFARDEQTGSALERTEHLAEERLGLGLSGTVLSPRFLQFELDGVAGLSENWSSDGSTSEFDTGETYEGEASIHMFPNRFHPFDFQFSRYDDLQPRTFLSKLESRSTLARAGLSFLSSDGLLRFELSHREIEQSVFGAEAEPVLKVAEDTAGVSGDWRITENQTLAGSYHFQHVDQRSGENSFAAHDALATHSLFLGADREHYLRSRLEARLQEGEFDQELFRWNESFEARIAEDLRSSTLFEYERNDTDLIELEVLRGETGLTHQLYESLTSSLYLRGGRLTADGESTTDTAGGSLSLNYRKTTPLGILRVSYLNTVERRISENDRGGAIDEPHTFPLVPPEEIRLLRSGIDPESIVLTDPSGLIFYRRDLDYTVRQETAGLTTIRRGFSGNIPPGGQVLADYTFRTATDFTLDSLSQAFRAEHEFHGGLTPYFAFQHQGQDFREIEGFGEVVPVRERAFIGGVEWRRPQHLLGAEYESRESSVVPFDAVRLRAQASIQVAEGQQLTGSVQQAWTFFRDPDRDVNAVQGNLRWHAIAGRSRFYADGALHYEDDNLQGETWGFAVGVGLEHRWRRFLFRIHASHRESYGVTSDFREDEVGISVVREFGEPPPGTAAAIQRFVRQ